MFKSKIIRTTLILIGAVIIVSFFILPFNKPATTDAALIIPAPTRPTVNPISDGDGGESDDGDSDSNNAILAAIYGQVMDLSTGQPGRGLEVKINESIVRTDSEGRYSLTGLRAGAYIAQLQLEGQATAAQDPTRVHLTAQETVTLDLSYYSQPKPTPTPTHTPPPTPTPVPTEETITEDTIGDTVALETEINDVSDTFSPLTPATNGNPAVWINPGHINNEEGVAGNIAVDVSNVADFGAFQATLKFNPKIIQVDNVAMGNFLDSTGRETNPLVTEIDNTSGEISFITFTSGDTAGPNGGGTLAVVEFTSKQKGVSKLELNDVRLVARLGKIIKTQVGNGQINVIVCFGDLNNDQIIDVGDVQTVAGRMNQSLGDTNYVLAYDLNNDNLINEEDVMIITERLYETCP